MDKTELMRLMIEREDESTESAGVFREVTDENLRACLVGSRMLCFQIIDFLNEFSIRDSKKAFRKLGLLRSASAWIHEYDSLVKRRKKANKKSS
jgi:hypothetical protein